MKTTIRLLTAATLALAAAPALAQNCPTQDVWPGGDWLTDTETTRASKAAEVAELEKVVFTLVGKDSERKGYRTDGFVVIKDGVVVYERYGRGFTRQNKHISWSVAKSFSSTLAGVAVHLGALALDDSICKYATEYSGDVCDITVRHAITFTTGLDWQEEYENASYQISSVIAMLYGEGHRDQLAHILKRHEVAHPPGSQWMYSTGDAELASAIVKRALQKKDPEADFWTVLFDKIGARIVFEEDEKGTPLGGSMVYATPRDFARLGYLMMNDGCWNGERLLPEGWVQAATTMSSAYDTTAADTEETPAGYSWWLNQPRPSHSQEKPWADVPGDAYAALGHWGQRIVVVPSLNLVVVRTGDDRDGSMPVNDFMKPVLEVTK